MKTVRRHPLLYEINTRALLTELSDAAGRPATLDDIPDAFLDRLRSAGADWVWLLGVWQTGKAGREISLNNPSLRAGYEESVPGFKDEDVAGSPFAVQDYTVNGEYGGDAALARLRRRMAERDLRLMLDFVVNHMAPDHAWVSDHPERFVRGTEADLVREPQNWARFPTGAGPQVVAYGRDPYFDGWPDTVQIEYRSASVREAMTDELERIAERCDGVRCDMAMLVEPEVFARTWGRVPPPDDAVPEGTPGFWQQAIPRIRGRHPEFTLMAEVYWDMEWQLQQHGFDYTYDKRLYDRLRDRSGRPVREHLMADPAYQNRSARFLENHDEPRAAATFPLDVHRPAAIVTFLVPGLRFFHEGQLQGRRRHLSMHLRRRAAEPDDPEIEALYRALLPVLGRPEVHEGTWTLWPPRRAWEGNPTHDAFVVFSWEQPEGGALVAAVNYGPTQGQCYVPLGLARFAQGGPVVLQDLLGPARYEREADRLRTEGLYLDLPPWGHHVFEVTL